MFAFYIVKLINNLFSKDEIFIFNQINTVYNCDNIVTPCNLLNSMFFGVVQEVKMGSVTQVVNNHNKTIISIRRVHSISFDDGIRIDDKISSPAICGMAADYLIRWKLGQPLSKAFRISLLGASLCKQSEKAKGYLEQITDLDNASIAAACNLVRYDSVYRKGTSFLGGFDYEDTDQISIQRLHDPIRIMVKRTVKFFDENKDICGEIIDCGSVFPDGYTPRVETGDCDYVTDTGIWDLRCSKKKPTGKDVMQVATYLIRRRSR